MGWKGSWRAFAERTRRINEANLSVNQNGGGAPGREVLFTHPIKMPLKLPLLQECHTGSPWDKVHMCVFVCVSVHTCMCGSLHTICSNICCLSLPFCLTLLILSLFSVQ